jgi:hypothetical protein
MAHWFGGICEGIAFFRALIWLVDREDRRKRAAEPSQPAGRSK